MNAPGERELKQHSLQINFHLFRAREHFNKRDARELTYINVSLQREQRKRTKPTDQQIGRSFSQSCTDYRFPLEAIETPATYLSAMMYYVRNAGNFRSLNAAVDTDTPLEAHLTSFDANGGDTDVSMILGFFVYRLYVSEKNKQTM